MSKRKSRSIRTLPEDFSLLKHPSPEIVHNFTHERCYFGERVWETPLIEKSNVLSSEDSLENVLLGIRDLGTNSKSSSSSLSWGEDCRNEASRQVKDELERMDRILRGIEPIPENYDKEEYREWMEFFPNLCVLGDPNKSPLDYKEAITPGADETTSTERLKTEIKNAITEQIYKTITRQSGDVFGNKVNRNNVNMDSCLKITPMTGSSKEPLHQRQQSTRSLASSHMSASKWLKDDETEFNSLPFLIGVKGLLPPKERNRPLRGILKNNLVLPPITSNQFRSISATPRRATKSLSALSVNRLDTKRNAVDHFREKTAKNKSYVVPK